MSTHRFNPQICKALIGRKVRPLGAGDAVIRAAQRRAWRSVRDGRPAPAAIRDAVSWAADHTDRPIHGRESPE